MGGRLPQDCRWIVQFKLPHARWHEPRRHQLIPLEVVEQQAGIDSALVYLELARIHLLRDLLQPGACLVLVVLFVEAAQYVSERDARVRVADEIYSRCIQLPTKPGQALADPFDLAGVSRS